MSHNFVKNAMATFFIADTHFGDAHLVERRRRGFASLEAHDAALIERRNVRVGAQDEVWHLGDFAAHASREHCAAVFARLNGIKRLVRGNHDSNPRARSALGRAAGGKRPDLGDGWGGPTWRLFPGPLRPPCLPGLWRETRHLYGHTHATLPDTTRSCDVGVDAWDFSPVAIGEIVARQDTATLVPEELAPRAQR
jgi:calcineurin-like phosphoesterase family protein